MSGLDVVLQWIILGAFISLVLVWAWLKWRRVKNYWADRGVPYEPPHPLLGSLTFLQRENPALWMRKMYNKYRTPYVGIWLFWQPGLLVHCPELAKKVLVKDAEVFRNRFLGSGKSDPIGALNLFTVNDPLWSNMRRRLTSVFTSSKLRAMEGLVREKVNDFLWRIDDEMKKDPSLMDLRVMCTDMTTDVIGEAALGVRSQCARAGDSAVRAVTRDFMRFSAYRGLCWSSIFFMPSLVDVFGFSFFPKSTTDYLRVVFRSIVRQRGGADAPVTEPRDLLDALLKMKQDAAKDNEELSEDVLVAQAAVFLQGGFDTAGGTLAFALYELAHQPHLQERLYEEALHAAETHGTDELDFNQLAELPYLNAVIKETLRKYPPMGWLDRVASTDYEIAPGVVVRAGSPVYVNAIGMHYDETYFPDPVTFNPDRFMPDNERNIKPYTYLPFGEGPRNCIGMRFALNTVRCALFATARAHRVCARADAPPPAACPLDPRGLFLVPMDNMAVIFTPRN